MAVYIEDGNYRPFSALVATPRGSNAIAVRNTANLEFPLAGKSCCLLPSLYSLDVCPSLLTGPVLFITVACVEPENGDAGLWDIFDGPDDYRLARTVQGGSVHTIPFAPEVESVQLLLKTDGRPLNARVELLQGPNNNKQVCFRMCILWHVSTTLWYSNICLFLLTTGYWYSYRRWNGETLSRSYWDTRSRQCHSNDQHGYDGVSHDWWVSWIVQFVYVVVAYIGHVLTFLRLALFL